jgi:glycine cleavage system H protein
MENIFSSYNTVQVNKGPFDEGWIMKVKLKDRDEIQSLLDAEKYKQHVEESAH